jgi:hypothetical protein
MQIAGAFRIHTEGSCKLQGLSVFVQKAHANCRGFPYSYRRFMQIAGAFRIHTEGSCKLQGLSVFVQKAAAKLFGQKDRLKF